MDLWKPAILSIRPFGIGYDRELTAESRTGGGSYILNLYRYTCTCPDFLSRRHVHPVGDLRRTCKHLRDAVLALEVEMFGDELTRVIFKSAHGPYDAIWFAPGPSGEIAAVGLVDGKPWMNLFVRPGLNQPYTRYGYHPGEKRWSFDHAPPDADGLLDLMARIPGITVSAG